MLFVPKSYKQGRSSSELIVGRQFCAGGCEEKTLCVIFRVCNSVRLL
jgi:hypothetical protein